MRTQPLFNLVLGALVCTQLYVSASSSLNLPADISEDLFCSACKATVKEFDKLVTTAQKNSIKKRIDNALGSLCVQTRFQSHDYAASKMVRTCKYILENFREALEDLAARHYAGQASKAASITFLTKDFCRISTKACLQIEDRESERQKKKMKDNLANEEKRLNEEITKIPENAKFPNPVHVSGWRGGEEQSASPVATEEEAEADVHDESIDAPLHGTDSHVHVHTEL